MTWPRGMSEYSSWADIWASSPVTVADRSTVVRNGRPDRHGERARASAAQLVLLQETTPDDHLLDVGRALADQQHRRLAVEPLDLVLLGVAVAAMDAERVLDDLLAVLAGEVLGHAGL